MAKNNDVFSIIPISGATAKCIVDTSKTPGDLLAGEVGVFDYKTGKALDATAALAVSEFFVAAAVDTTGDGAVDEILTSAGNKIAVKDIQSYELKCYAATVEQVIDVHSITADCDTQYGLKVEFNLDQKYASYGFNQDTKNFMVKTACCEGCETCGTGNCAELVRLLMADINADEDGLVTATAFANVGQIQYNMAGATVIGANGTVKATIDGIVIAWDVLAGDGNLDLASKAAAAINAHGTFSAKSDGVDTVKITMKGAAFSGTKSVGSAIVSGATNFTAVDTPLSTTAITDLTDAATGFKAIYGDGCPSLRLTSVTQAVNSYCSVNTKYYQQRTPIMTVSKVGDTGFECMGTIVTTTNPTLRQGAGYDLAQIEYEVGGFIGKPGPYSTGEMVGVAFSDFNSVVSKTLNYHMVDLTYDVKSNGGWLDYNNHFNTKFVFPCGEIDTKAGAAFLTVLDAAVTQQAGTTPTSAGNGFTVIEPTADDCAC